MSHEGRGSGADAVSGAPKAERGGRGAGRGVGLAAALGVAIAACGGAGAAPSGAPGPADSTPGTTSSTDPGSVPAAAPTAPPAEAVTCGRAPTAPAALFDAFRADVLALPASARAARVDKLLADVAAQGGTPLEDPKSDRVVFLVRGAPPSGPWSVVGSFEGWNKAQAPAMQAVDGTDVSWVEVTIPRGASQQYKLLSGTADAGFVQDRLAKNVAWDGIDHHTVGEFNAIVHPADQPSGKGRLLFDGRAHAQKLADDRDVFVYLPARYDDAACPKLPAVLFHDGNEALTRGDFAGVADALYAKRPDLSAVLAFVALPTQDVREAEYTFGAGERGDDYVDFLVSDLLPTLAKRYHLCKKAEARGISGASLGGLISTYADFQAPGTFGWVGAQSPSFWWAGDALVTRAETSPRLATRFYLDSGAPNGLCAEDDNCAVTDQMAQVMKAKGYDVLRVKEPNAIHDWPFWQGRLAGMLTHFRDGQTACD